MLIPDISCNSTAGHRQHCWHEEAGRHLAPCNDGAHQGPGIGHGEEVAVLGCGVPCQQPHIEEEGQLGLNELSFSVCVPAPYMRQRDVIAASSDCQPWTLVAIVCSLTRTDPTARRVTPRC